MSERASGGSRLPPRVPRPRAILFDLFHTLVSVPPPEATQGVAEILGVDAQEWQRLYYGDDVLGRCVGRVRDAHEIMRTIARRLDPAVSEERVRAALDSRRARFHAGLVDVEPRMLGALDRLQAAGIRTALVSDAGADDVESWEHSPLRERLDLVVFSHAVGVRKPDARIYRHALDALNVEPSDALFVGDGGSDEHRGASAVGLTSVLVTRLYAHWRPEEIAARRLHADHEFEDVPALVDAMAL